MIIVDDLVSIDNLIEDYLILEFNNEYIQSCDIVVFNKICKCLNFLVLEFCLQGGLFGVKFFIFEIQVFSGIFDFCDI